MEKTIDKNTKIHHTGLTHEQAAEKLKEHGRNELVRKTKANPLRMLVKQFISPLMLLLIAAAIISIAIGYFPGQEPDIVDAILILIIVLISGILGFIQDYRAEKTIEALQKMSTPVPE